MLIQISKIRSNGSVSAIRVDELGRITPFRLPLSVTLPKHFRDIQQVGSVWRVEEAERSEITFAVNGFTITEEHIRASNAEYVKPNTRLIETWLKKNIEGIGDVKAARLARTPDLVERIEAQDVEYFEKQEIGPSAVSQLYTFFPRDEYIDAINWLSKRNLPVKLAYSISTVWQDRTIEMLEDNPFRLMQFNVPFNMCRGIADDFGIRIDDPRHKAALAVSLIDEYCTKTSSTFMPMTDFQVRCAQISVDAADILKYAADSDLVGYLEGVNGLQLEGPFLIEALVGMKLRNAMDRSDGSGSIMADWELRVTEKQIATLLFEFENTIPFSLTDEQRMAVSAAFKSKVLSLSGGAGTGKTTILNAILTTLEKASGARIIQLALSGRAAQRMSEATKREASTIAKFCIDMKNTAEEKRPEHCIVVLDEASMIDLYSMHNLLEYLPGATRFLFVGDVEQLPPVGGGLIFHVLMNSDFPSVALTAVKRQEKESGVHKFATAVRTGYERISLPDYTLDPDLDCALLPSIEPDRIESVFSANGGVEKCVVLTSIQSGLAGVRNLNKIMQKRLGYARPKVVLDGGNGHFDYISSQGNRFYLNDAIIITKNSYDVDVRNGDLGTITQVVEEPKAAKFGTLSINGREIEITPDLLEKMELGFAMTIHKSQGSQWESVVLVIDRRARRMLDKTLLYTGATRAIKKLVICCESTELLTNIVSKGSIAHSRNTNLLAHLNSIPKHRVN